MRWKYLAYGRVLGILLCLAGAGYFVYDTRRIRALLGWLRNWVLLMSLWTMVTVRVELLRVELFD